MVVTTRFRRASAVVTAGSANTGEHSPSQKARLARLRGPAARVPLGARLANEIEDVCDDVERVQLLAVTARDDEAVAWLMLVDRGWPAECGVEDFELTPVFAWLAAWSELVSLPVAITTTHDKSKLRWIEERLTQCEAPLETVLPGGLRQLIGPLDQTGRATLAYVLQSLAVLAETRTHAASAAERLQALLGRFAVFRQQARTLGVRAPLAPLDLRAWRATADTVRAIRD